jgi:cytochrome c oxidase assembly protein subunit 11
VSFLAANLAGATTTGAATFNVTPEDVAPYFNKIACFCFTDQTLAAGARVALPVTFFIDPAMAANTDLATIDTITLSYSFFPSTPPAKPVAAIDTSGRGG